MNDLTLQIAQLRREYISHPLVEELAAVDPFAQFKTWFEEIIKVEQPDPEAMTLSTATRDGHVSARMVLLRGFDARGFAFFTNYESRKSNELAANPRAALTFYWHALNRQVRIEGVTEKVTREESEEYFRTRPRGSMLGAWASPQSRTIPNRGFLDRLIDQAGDRFGDGEIECPPFWGGFRLKPERVEFWQGRESRLHDRILYSLTDEGWKISRLAP